jgi:enoyl-CoA hydratase
MCAVRAWENLRYTMKDGIAFITISRSKVLNALDRRTMCELGQAFQVVREDGEIGAAILTGEGEKAFVAGADITELASLGADEAVQLSARGQAVFSEVEHCGKPVIAAVNGFALGAGCELTLACSIRIASQNARFGQPEVRLGLIPGYGGTQRLPRLVGKGWALQLILSGDIIGAEEAQRIGLVNEVVPPSELLTRAELLARKMVANGPIALRYAIQAVHEGMEMNLAEAMAHEAALFGLVCTTEDKAEGTHAFLEKRAPLFQGK